MVWKPVPLTECVPHSCPVDINTGDLVKRLRRENHSAFQNKVAVRVSSHFKFFEAIAKSSI